MRIYWIIFALFFSVSSTDQQQQNEQILENKKTNAAEQVEVIDDLPTIVTGSTQNEIEQEVPTMEHIKLIRPDTDLEEPTPTDIQNLLNDDEFSEQLLAHGDIPESVKQFFIVQRSPALEAVVPSFQPVHRPSLGSSKAPNLMDILLGTAALESEYEEYTLLSTGQDGDIEDDDDDDDDSLDKPSRRIKCIPKTLPTNETYTSIVQILSSTELLERLGNKNDYNNNCAVVLFFAPWCTFCARVGPHFNALARVFPQLDVFAIDAAHFSKFGTVAVPNILIFHNAKAIARFNESERVLDNLAAFVSNITGLEANKSVTLQEEDYHGPLPSLPSDDADYLLYLSWIFIISFCCYMACKSTAGVRLLQHFGNLEHQHIE